VTALVGLIHSSPRLLPSLLPVSVTGVALGVSPQPEDWIGRWQADPKGDGSWKLLAADLAVDRMTGKTQMRMRTYSDRIAELARRESWSGLHQYGVGGQGALVSAVAAAELGLPLLLSFADGEVETAVYGQPVELRTALRAATAFTAPSRAEEDLVRRFLAPPGLSSVVVPALVVAHEAVAEAQPLLSPRPLLGCWGRLGRDSGLAVMLELADKLEASLALIGPFEKAEMYDLSSLIDRHRLSERIFRFGDLAGPQALSVLCACDLAVFPMAGSGQAQYALDALAAGARVIASAVGPLAEVEGLATVAPSGNWESAVREALGGWKAPLAQWADAYSPTTVSSRWKEAYELAGLCT
jgi:hypothetical protein